MTDTARDGLVERSLLFVGSTTEGLVNFARKWPAGDGHDTLSSTYVGDLLAEMADRIETLEAQHADTEYDIDRLRECANHEANRVTELETQHAEGVKRNGELVSALERLDYNFDLLLAGKPVRDVAETKAETQAALQSPDGKDASHDHQ